MEILISLSVIGVLSAIIIIAVNDSRERAGIADALRKIREVQKAVDIYQAETKQFPPVCDNECTQETDPFVNDLGVSGWRGPYITLWNLTHYWKGHVSFETRAYDLPEQYYYVRLNDDRPQTSNSNNSGRIPDHVLIKIDEILDDGNLETGEVRGNGIGTDPAYFWTVPGELAGRFRL